jgi:hypothetical protein
MQANGHEKRIAKIEANCAKLKEQIMRLEFQNKKDIAAARRRFDEWDAKIRKRIDYIAKLAGITYEELDNLDLKVQDAGRVLATRRKHSTLS